MKALFAGSFDPVTTGHLNLIMRASRIFEEVVVAVVINPAKNTSLSKEKRLELLEKCTGHLNNVKVVEEDGLTVDAAWKHDCGVLIRGIRSGKDTDYEIELEYYNKRLSPPLETVYLSTKPELMHVSSTRVKELILFGRDVKGLVPELIREEVEELLSK